MRKKLLVITIVMALAIAITGCTRFEFYPERERNVQGWAISIPLPADTGPLSGKTMIVWEEKQPFCEYEEISIRKHVKVFLVANPEKLPAEAWRSQVIRKWVDLHFTSSPKLLEGMPIIEILSITID